MILKLINNVLLSVPLLLVGLLGVFACAFRWEWLDVRCAQWFDELEALLL